jgi:hypothetical protein
MSNPPSISLLSDLYLPRGTLSKFVNYYCSIQVKVLGVFVFIETIGYVSKLKALL